MKDTKHLLVVDTETNEGAVDNKLTDLWCIGVYDPKLNQSFIYSEWETHREFLQKLFDERRVIFHNAAFDIWVLEHFGFTIHDYEDTMVMSYCLLPTGTHSLKGLGEYLGCEVTKTEFSDWSHFSEEMGIYCANDCVSTWHIYEALQAKIDKDVGVQNIHEVERQFVRSIIELEHNGVYINRTKWDEVLAELTTELNKIEDEIKQIVSLVPGKVVVTKNPRSADTVCTEDSLELDKYLFLSEDAGKWSYKKVVEFNPNSTDHVAWALKSLYNWECMRVSAKTGKPTVDKEVLSELDYPLSRLLVKQSKVNKVVTTYGQSLLDRIGEDGRLRGSFNQCITKTGRLSSSNPNLQNIPSRGEIGDTIRHLFTAAPGKVLVGCDVDAFQMRILAWYLYHCLGDKYPDATNLFVDFNTNENPDPHQAKADLIGTSRSIAKNCNFGGIFGFGAAKFASMSDISIGEAQRIIKQEKEMNPSLDRLKKMVWACCRHLKGYVYDLYGRRGYYPDILSKDKQLAAQAERQVFNFVIQSTEASIIKQWINKTVEALKLNQVPAKLVLQVHDEVMFECDEEWVNIVEQTLQYHLQEEHWLPDLKLTGTPKHGNSWGEIH